MVATEFGNAPRIDKVWFRTRYGQNFPDLLEDDTDSILEGCIDSVYTMFHGVSELWNHLSREIYTEKTQMCYGLLTAWYIADIYPSMTLGVMTTGGIPLKSKQIGGTKISFGDTASKAGAVNNADLLQSLKSNAFGAKAYMMIKTSGKINLFFSR